MAQSRNGVNSTAWARIVLACVALAAVLVARHISPSFPAEPSIHSAFSANSHHDQRPRFNNDGLQWCAPADVFLPAPPVARAAHLASAAEPLPKLQTKGFHYNRPPPLSSFLEFPNHCIEMC
jgi:hypothetical protein